MYEAGGTIQDQLKISSFTELKNQLLIARDVGYLNQKDMKSLALQANTTHKLLYGLIKKSKTFI